MTENTYDQTAELAARWNTYPATEWHDIIRIEAMSGEQIEVLDANGDNVVLLSIGEKAWGIEPDFARALVHALVQEITQDDDAAKAAFDLAKPVEPEPVTLVDVLAEVVALRSEFRGLGAVK